VAASAVNFLNSDRLEGRPGYSSVEEVIKGGVYYVHPAILDSYLTGSLLPTLKQGERQQAAYAGLGLSPEEYCVMVTVAAHQEKLAREARSKAA
jgi:hypothetical protein